MLRRENGQRGEALGVGALVVMGGERIGAQQRVGNGFRSGKKAALDRASGGKDPEPVATGGTGEESNTAAAGRAVAAGEQDGGLGAHSLTRQRRRIGCLRVGRGAK